MTGIRPARPCTACVRCDSAPSKRLGSVSTEIAAAPREERLAHARAIRRRIKEIQDRLTIRLPIYAIFTKADLLAAEEQLRLYGVDKDHPSSLVNVYAPISGVVIGQNITNSAAAGVALSGSATAFTIADLTNVWILCDVYENDIPKIKLGQQARIKVNSYPDRVVTGRIGDIGPVLDPQSRTAKVRIEVANPGFLKLGMFVTATFSGNKTETHPVVPADAVLHLHDRDWVFEPAGENHFRRIEVHTGQMIGGNRQVIQSGLEPRQRIVANALLLETAGNQ